MHIYLLRREVANGEYCEDTHFSAHGTLSSALNKFEELITPEEKAGQDATNEWRQDTDENGSFAHYRTGNWGYIIYSIRRMNVEDLFENGLMEIKVPSSKEWDEFWQPLQTSY